MKKVVIVGCGYWGKNLVRNFAELGVLEAVCDAHVPLAERMSQHYGVPVWTFEQTLAHQTIDGVVIAAPAAQHYDLTKRALLAGKNVFVEKPLSLNVSEAEHLCAIAKEQGCLLMVGHLLQYHPAFIELKNLIRKGSLGRLQYIYSNRLNLGKFRREENILWSFAPHDLSMILALVNDLPESVYATGVSHLHPGIEDVTTTHLTFKNGMRAHIFVSWLHPFKEQKLVVVGDRGMAVFDDGLPWGEKLQLYPHQVDWIDGMPTPTKADVIHVPLDVSEPLKLECQHFIDAMLSKTQPCTNGDEGLRVLRVLDAAQESLAKKASVMLQQALPLAYFRHASAIVDEGCKIGAGTKVWHFSHIIKGTTIGQKCIIGQNVVIGPDVKVGDHCKVQNNVSLYKGVILEDGVFCGPSCVFTNVNNPRAEVERKNEFRPTYVERGATIGANATIVCGVRLGAYCFIGAGAVVTKDVKPHALMVGNPARQIGWMSHAGERLGDDMICSREGRHYQVTHDGGLMELESPKPSKVEQI